MKTLKKLILPCLFAGAVSPTNAAIIASPAVTGGSNAFGQTSHDLGGFTSSNVFDRNRPDYASNGAGINTNLQFTFASPSSFDTVVVVNRNSNNTNDLISNYTLTFDSGSNAITRSGARGAGGFDSLGGLVTTTSVSLQVDSVAAGGNGTNVGAIEIFFLRTPAGMALATGVTVAAAAPAFSSDFAADNAVNNLLGIGTAGIEYASSGQGANAFVTLDLGSVQEVGGFDFFDRIGSGSDVVTSFDMTFSEDAAFTNPITQSYTGSTQSAEFAGVNARFVRWDATGASPGGNTGMSEMRLFTVIPEPSVAMLGGLSMLGLLRRRRA